jgi:hypothetical protein
MIYFYIILTYILKNFLNTFDIILNQYYFNNFLMFDFQFLKISYITQMLEQIVNSVWNKASWRLDIFKSNNCLQGNVQLHKPFQYW